jgi:hypothetical protein
VNTKVKHPRHVRAAIKAARKISPQVNDSAPSFADFLAQMSAAGADQRSGDAGIDDVDSDDLSEEA